VTEKGAHLTPPALSQHSPALVSGRGLQSAREHLQWYLFVTSHHAHLILSHPPLLEHLSNTAGPAGSTRRPRCRACRPPHEGATRIGRSSEDPVTLLNAGERTIGVGVPSDGRRAAQEGGRRPDAGWHEAGWTTKSRPERAVACWRRRPNVRRGCRAEPLRVLGPLDHHVLRGGSTRAYAPPLSTSTMSGAMPGWSYSMTRSRRCELDDSIAAMRAR
jgi:hypothetical protein